MSTSLALDVFNKLIGQVHEAESVASGIEVSNPQTASIIRRSAYVLAVAALDTYFHEQAARRLFAAAQLGSPDDSRVASYLQSVAAADVAGPSGESYIRMRLSYKTLVAPRGIDAAITAWGGVPEDLWRDFSFALASRPDRERRQLELLYDRRNQIAHEGDWDIVQLDFRQMTTTHLKDCIGGVTRIAGGFDGLI